MSSPVLAQKWADWLAVAGKVLSGRNLAMAGAAMLAAGCQVIPKTDVATAAPPPAPTPEPSATALPTDAGRHRIALLVPMTGDTAPVGIASTVGRAVCVCAHTTGRTQGVVCARTCMRAHTTARAATGHSDGAANAVAARIVRADASVVADMRRHALRRRLRQRLLRLLCLLCPRRLLAPCQTVRLRRRLWRRCRVCLWRRLILLLRLLRLLWRL